MSILFWMVYEILQAISALTGLSYEMVNVLVWYAILPGLFLFLIDRITRRSILLPVFLVALTAALIFDREPNRTADQIFIYSVHFLQAFSRFGINYDLASVIVCLWIPAAALLILAHFAFPAWFEKYTPNLSKHFRKKQAP